MGSMTDIEQTDESVPNADFLRLKKWVKDGRASRSKWFKSARMAYQFVAGHQWSAEDKEILREQNRPEVTFNRTAPIVKAVCGLEINNRQQVVYLPREQGDVGVDEALTATARWLNDGCDAEDEESLAFRDMAICGEGWTESRMDFDIDPKGCYVEERVDPMEMGCNASARRANYIDRRMTYRVRDMDVADAQALFEQSYMADVIDAKWLNDSVTPADGGRGNKLDYPDETRAGVPQSEKRDTVKVCQVQWWDREKVNLVATEEKLLELSDEEFATLQQRHAALTEQAALDPLAEQVPPLDHARVTKRVYYEAFLGATTMLEKRRREIQEFSFQPMTADYDPEDKCFYGIVNDLFDPQRWANKWLSQSMNVMNSNAKGGIIAEADVFVNVRKAQKDWADPTKMVIVKPGGMKKIKERQPIPMPPGLENLLTFAIGSMRDVTGVNLELLGQADREQAASLEAQRRQSAMTILASLFNSKRRFTKRQGKLLLYFIQLLPQGTLIRVLEKGQYKYVPTMQLKDVEKYDVIIDEAPTSPDQKQYIWAMTTQLLSQGIPLPPAAIAALLKYSPYPETVVKEISDAMGLGSEIPPEQMKVKLQQAEQALQVMEQHLKDAMDNAKTAEDTQKLEVMKVQIEEYRAETERMKVQLDAEAKDGARQDAAVNAEADRHAGVAQAVVAASVPDASNAPEPDSSATPPAEDQTAARLDRIEQMLMQLLQPAQQPIAEEPDLFQGA
jgi:hypothetical protein